VENLELREILSLKRIMNLGTNLEARYQTKIPINLSFLAFELLNWFYKNGTKVGEGKNHSFKTFKKCILTHSLRLSKNAFSHIL
jgi:hypothetical protein